MPLSTLPGATVAFAVSFSDLSDSKTLRARADAILWIRSAMARHGVSIEQLEMAGCFTSRKSDEIFEKSARYKDAEGHAWNGVGALPDWLQRAVNAGQSIEHFKTD